MGALNGKIALVIGASSPKGLGEAVARLFAAEGAKVVVTGRKKESVEALAADLGGEAIACDLTKEETTIAAIEHCVSTYGKLDIAVNSAGIYIPGAFSEMTWDSLTMYSNAHFIGPVLFIKHAADAMAKTGGGSIMTMSSLTVEHTGAGTTGYAASKAATDKAVKQAAVEYGPMNVRVNSLSPGLTPTPMTEQLFAVPTMVTAFEKETPIGRLPTPEEVAFAALYLADDRCSATGDYIRISGGGHLRRLPTMEEMMGA
ncbi:MAG: SDR family oxidoreductase [Pseudomonadota bacterium]